MLRKCDPGPTHAGCPFHKLVGGPPGGVATEGENKPETAVTDYEASCSTGLVFQCPVAVLLVVAGSTLAVGIKLG